MILSNESTIITSRDIRKVGRCTFCCGVIVNMLLISISRAGRSPPSTSVPKQVSFCSRIPLRRGFVQNSIGSAKCVCGWVSRGG